MKVPGDFPCMETIDSERIYMDADYMFPGIEHVYPEKDIRSQKVEQFEESEGGRIHCSHCGNTQVFVLPRAFTTVNITVGQNGNLIFKLRSPDFPVGKNMNIMYTDYDDEADRENSFMGQVEDYLQNQGTLICPNCGHWAGWETDVLEDHDPDCPGCFLCVRANKMDAIEYCTTNAVKKNCEPGEDCQGCRGYFNMMQFNLSPEIIIESGKIIKHANNKLIKANKEVMKINGIHP